MKNLNLLKLKYALLICCCQALPGLAQTVQTVPHLINYQGTLVDSTGTILPDGNYVLAFSIYSNSPPTAPVWGPQIFDGANGTGHGPTVALLGGRFNLVLGQFDTNTQDIVNALGGTNRYLGITVGTNAASTNIIPLQQVLSAPYALKAASADSLGGLGGWEQLFGPGVTNATTASIQGYRIANNSITSVQIASGAVGSNQIAVGSIVGTNLAVPFVVQGNSPFWLIQITNNGGPAIGGFSPYSSGVVGEGNYNGVYGIATSSAGFGVRADGQQLANGQYVGPGLVADGNPAAIINGNLQVSGTKNFKIDHPMDPANKYLLHSAVESSDMKNMYDGIATLDDSGRATIQLPAWFESLNRDFRYQLTAIGAPAPGLFVAKEISQNSFEIAGGSKDLKVSWQVTGSRQDAWAVAHPMQVEEAKPPTEQGLYLTPLEHGQPKEKGIFWTRLHAGTPAHN